MLTHNLWQRWAAAPHHFRHPLQQRQQRPRFWVQDLDSRIEEAGRRGRDIRRERSHVCRWSFSLARCDPDMQCLRASRLFCFVPSDPLGFRLKQQARLCFSLRCIMPLVVQKNHTLNPICIFLYPRPLRCFIYAAIDSNDYVQLTLGGRQ